jgi:CRP/FNR family transcriptional regulator, anaerobic regulatory protein
MPATDCSACHLRRMPLFTAMNAEEVAFMSEFKIGEITAAPGVDVILQGKKSTSLYTVLSGLGLRTILLEDGRRQVVSFVFPGDLVGLQAGIMGEARHSVTALTEMKLCGFGRNRVWELFNKQPERAYDLTWIAAIEEHFLGETIATLGQRDATERVAWALVRIWRRLVAVGLGQDGKVPFPFRQQDLADALGLSVVHTNRVLTTLRKSGRIELGRGALRLVDHPGLAELAGLQMEVEEIRPIL